MQHQAQSRLFLKSLPSPGPDRIRGVQTKITRQVRSLPCLIHAIFKRDHSYHSATGITRHQYHVCLYGVGESGRKEVDKDLEGKFSYPARYLN